MKRSIKSMQLMVLLLCLLLQGAAWAMTLPATTSMPACGHHSAARQYAGHDGRSHSQCCQSAHCGCLQMPALLTWMPSLAAFVAARETAAVPKLLSLAAPPAKFFRPPI